MGRDGNARTQHQISVRRAEVRCRRAGGASLPDIAASLKCPLSTIKKDARWVREHKDIADDLDGTLVIGRVLNKLWDIVNYCDDRLQDKIDALKIGKTTTEEGVPLVRGGKSKPTSEAAIVAAATNELVPLKVIRETYLPNLADEASLLRVKRECLETISKILGYGQDKAPGGSGEGSTFIIGKAIITEKLSTDEWKKHAKAYDEDERVIEVVTSDDKEGD